jgi:FdrA protein
VIREVGEKGIEVVSILIGTDEDPQNLTAQMDQLQEAGSHVFRTAAEAVAYISLRYQQYPRSDAYPRVDPVLLNQPLAAINVGLDSFYDSLISQGAQAIQVEWRPPAGGNEKLASLLARMKK